MAERFDGKAVRSAIVELLKTRPMTERELREALHKSRGSITHNLMTLIEAKVIRQNTKVMPNLYEVLDFL